MKAFVECVPCIINQTFAIMHKLGTDERTKEHILKGINEVVSKLDITCITPPELTDHVHQYLKKALKVEDLYYEDKIDCNRMALAILPIAEKILAQSEDKLLTAIKIAIAGNLIDYGALASFEVSDILDKYVHQNFAVNDLDKFFQALKKSKHVIYIGDNAGEIVFDKLLIKELQNIGKQVTYVVKSAPVLNDVMIKDAVDVGMTELTKVIQSGSTTAGTLLSQATPEFKVAFDQADLIISKGMGNLETLSEEMIEKPLFFLLLSKCVHISKMYNINKFDMILMEKSNNLLKLH